MHRNAVLELVSRRGIPTRELARRERWDWQQRWREAFAQQVKAQTGKWLYGGLHWHTFSSGFSRSESGSVALDLYLTEPAQRLLVIPEDDVLAGFECTAAPIDFSESGQDVLVFPSDLRWTMTFTHEQPELGPYFSRAVWCQMVGA